MDPFELAHMFVSKHSQLKGYSILNILDEYLNQLNEINDIENEAPIKPNTYINLIGNELKSDKFDFSLLEKSMQKNYDEDVSIYDNNNDDDNDNNNDDSDFVKSYKSFLDTFDEVLENDYNNEPKDYNKETILAKVLTSVTSTVASSSSSKKKKGPKPNTVKASPSVGQKRKVVNEVIKSTKRTKTLTNSTIMRKWITSDDPNITSAISTDVLRCLVSEFKNHGVTGHAIFEIEESVAVLLKERIINNREDELSDIHDGSNEICEMPLDLSVTLKGMFDDDIEASNQHKASRIATSLGSECFNKIRDAQGNAHLALVAARRETSRSMKYYWETSATTLRVALHNLKKVSLNDVPDGANRLVNPFSSSGSKAEDKVNFEQWRWLAFTNTSSIDMESFDHSRVHPKSMYYGKVAAKDCLHNSIAPVSDDSTTTAPSSSMESLDPIPEHLTLPFQKVSDIMKKDYGLIIIDKNTHRINDDISSIDVQNKVPHHRATLIYDILRRQMFGVMQRAEGKRNMYEERWGPVLIVVKETHLEIWEEAFKRPGKKSNSNDPQLVTYSGPEAHRNYIKEYLKKDNGLYSNRSHCHIVLIPYSILLAEFVFFQNIIWDAFILDDPFGLLSNCSYGLYIEQLKQIKCKSKILSCSSLRQSDEMQVIPDMMEIMNFLLPEIVNILLCNEVLGKGDCLHLDHRSIRYILRLLASFTVVFDETAMTTLPSWGIPLVPYPSGEAKNIKNIKPNNFMEYLSLFEWLGIIPDNPTIVNVDHLLFSLEYKDNDLDNEFQDKILIKNPKYADRVKKGRSKKAKESESIEPKSKAKKTSTSATNTSKMTTSVIMGSSKDGPNKTNEDDEKMIIDDDYLQTKEEEFNTTKNDTEKSTFVSNNESETLAEFNVSDSTNYPNNDEQTLLLQQMDEGSKSSDANVEEHEKTGIEQSPMKTGTQKKEKAVKAKKGHSGVDEKGDKKKKEREPKKKDLTMEEERDQAIIYHSKLKTWNVDVDFLNRSRHLGAFHRESDAIVAFDTTYQIRSELQPRYDVLDKKNKEHQLAFPLFLRRGAKYATEADENLRFLDINNLQSELRLMILPRILADKSFSWTPKEQEQYSYAFLVDPSNKVIRISCHLTTFGNVGESVLENLEEIGIPQTQASYLGVYGLHHSINRIDGEVIHVSKEKSIASKHAKLIWNSQTGVFEILAISNAGIFVDTVKYLPVDGNIPIKSGAMIQIGCSIHFFLIPDFHNMAGPPPIQTRIAIVQDLINCSTTIYDRNDIKEEESIMAMSDGEEDEGDIDNDNDDDNDGDNNDNNENE